MTCPAPAPLHAWLLLPAPERDAGVTAHVEGCAACQAVVAAGAWATVDLGGTLAP